MDMATISAAFGALDSARVLVSGLVTTRDAVAMNDVKIGLQNAILEAQAGLFAAQQEVAAAAGREAQLKEQVMRLNDQRAERARYELIAIGEGTFVYQPKSGMREGEAPHWACTRCLDDGHRSILQSKYGVSDDGESVWSCHRCKTDIVTAAGSFPQYLRP